MTDNQSPKGYDEKLLKEHDFDGIQELDNDMPKWWIQLFIYSIVFGFIYLIWFHVIGSGSPVQDQFQRDVAAFDKANAAALEKNFSYENAAQNANFVAEGKKIFQTTGCVGCHGMEGQGIVGPNLTDNYWVYGHTAKEVEDVISEGTNKGMPAQKQLLGIQKIRKVVSYLITIQGSNPQNAKAAEGKEGELK